MAKKRPRVPEWKWIKLKADTMMDNVLNGALPGFDEGTTLEVKPTQMYVPAGTMVRHRKVGKTHFVQHRCIAGTFQTRR